MNTQPKINLLVMDIWSDYAFFRRGYTTTSPLTYPFPPRTTISGLLGCIMGMDYNEYYLKIENLFSTENSLFSIRLINPIKKIKINQNLVDTKTAKYQDILKLGGPLEYTRTQIPFEYLKEPKYRIFIWLKDENLFNKLCKMIEHYETIYTPYLGLASFIANFKYIGIYEAERLKIEESNVDKGVEIESVVLAEHMIKYENGKEYQRVRMPRTMKSDRSVRDTIDLIYERNGKPITILSGEYYYLKEYKGNVVLF